MKVVVVDDSMPNAMYMEGLAKKLDFVDTVVFTDPNKALQWCRAEQPDLILLDFVMPEMTGSEFIRRLIEERDNRNVPIIVITADEDRATLHDALEAGATDFVRKPVDPAELLARTRNLLKLRGNQIELAETVQRLHVLATTDMLTETANRRHFLERTEAEMARARRFEEHLSLAMLDADLFKKVNDTFGHIGGDAVLRALAQTCRQMLRSHDIVGRLGGEEFAICMPATAKDKAEVVCNRLRTAMADLVVASTAGDIRFTVSIGVAEYEANNDDLEAFMSRADQALYAAKDAGRNRVVVV